jgi:hypothetical protein
MNAGAPTDEENDEWNDHIGSSTFGRGAVGYKLSGTTHEFTRGTYSQNPADLVCECQRERQFYHSYKPAVIQCEKSQQSSCCWRRERELLFIAGKAINHLRMTRTIKRN